MDNVFNTHGAFSWSELTTTDVEACTKFYSELLGWELTKYPNPADKDMDYHIAKLNGKDVAGIMNMPKESPKGMPPAWASYVTVDDVDAVAKKAKELGGTIIFPPTDIPEVGRFCFIKDPTGAMLGYITYKKPK